MTCKPKRPLAVWQDADHDGVAEVGELKSLADVGVQSIKLNHDAVQTAQNGNTLQGFSSFTTTDGQTHQVVDAWLNTQLHGDGAAVAAATPVAADARVAAATPVADALLAAAAGVVASDPVVDVTINELAPTGLEPLVFQHVLPINCEPSVMVPPAPVDAALPTDTTAVVDQQQPTHCDEPWLIELNGPTGTEPVVFNLNPASWNKPFELSAEQMAQLYLPAPADSNLANPLKLNVSDVLLSPADANASQLCS